MSGTDVDQQSDLQHLGFMLRTHRALAPDPTVPACWSPFSVASALGLAATGARGATRAELDQVLLGESGHSLDGLTSLLRVATELTNAFPGRPDPVLGVSNTLWTRSDIPVNEDFGRELLSWPGGALRGAPFADPEAARQLVNTDVARATHDLIPELVPAGMFTERTVATLVNALYLKVAWILGFPKGRTQNLPFRSATDGVVEVPTMAQTSHYGHAQAHGWQAVSLPAGGETEAVVLLPERDLAEAEPGLDPATLADLLGRVNRTRVALTLPKFRADVRSDVLPALESLGVRELFTDRADLSGISSKAPLVVTDIVHQAVLSLDEDGLEGAAATAMGMRKRTAARVREEDPIEVRVDRPFLLLVRHPAGAVYFLARVVRPLTGGRA
jgi:serine protease inhibitor